MIRQISDREYVILGRQLTLTYRIPTPTSIEVNYAGCALLDHALVFSRFPSFVTDYCTCVLPLSATLGDTRFTTRNYDISFGDDWAITEHEPFPKNTILMNGWAINKKFLYKDGTYYTNLERAVPIVITRNGFWLDNKYRIYHLNEYWGTMSEGNIYGAWDWFITEIDQYWTAYYRNVQLISSSEPIDIRSESSIIVENKEVCYKTLLLQKHNLQDVFRPDCPIGILADYALDTSNNELYLDTQEILKGT